MWFRFLIFLPILTMVWLGVHYLVYLSSVFLFSLSSNLKTILLSVFMFMAISFLIASVLGHWFFNSFTRTYYWISVLWMGFFLNLLLITATAWIVISLLGAFNVVVPYKLICILIFVLATLLSAKGIWNTYHSRVTHITVSLKNLPEEWKEKNIVQISDIHLGQVHGAEFMKNVARSVNQLQPEAIFLTGDLFDGMDGKFEDYVEAVNTLQAPKGIFFVNGNHEIYLGLNRIKPLLEQTKMKLMNDGIVDLEGIQLVGINYPDFGQKVDFEKTLSNHNYDPARPSILLVHVPEYIDEAQKNNIDLQLSGHTHFGQLWPFGYVTRLAFRGFEYGLKKVGRYQIYTSNGVGTWGPPMRTSNRPEIVNITFE